MGKAQDLHVAVELDEEVFLGNPHVRAQILREAVPHWSPTKPATVATKMVEEDTELAPIDDVEGDVVEMRRPHADDRHLVMLGVEMKPDPGLAKKIRDVHAEDVDVERRHLRHVRGEHIDMAKLAGMEAGQGARAATGRWQKFCCEALSMGDQLNAATRRVDETQRTIGFAVVVHAAGIEVRRSGLKRAVSSEFPAGVVVIGFAILDELEAVVLRIAGEQCASALFGDHGQTKLDRPACCGLIDVEHTQTGVVQVV